MMHKEDLTILKKRSSHISNFFSLEFISARATNTRLMGVVALTVTYKDDYENVFVCLFHLDYESYGIDGFHLFCIKSPQKIYEETELVEVERIFSSLHGGLGGEFFNVDEKQVWWLLYTAFLVDENSIECFVDLEEYHFKFHQLGRRFNPSEHFIPSISDDSIKLSVFQKELLNKLSPKIDSEFSIINYALMRLVGSDYETAKYFFKDSQVPFKICEGPYTLLKCVSKCIDPLTERYIAELWIDYDDKYKYIVLEIELEDNKIIFGEIKDTLEITAIEMGFALKKNEYMYVYQIKNEMFERGFEYEQSHLMKTEFFNGNLYMKYNPDNSHVDMNTYYLNGDLYGLYFFTNSGQLILVSFEKNNLNQMREDMDKFFGEENYSYICEISAESSVINDFINSDYHSIFEFLEDGGEE